MWNDGDPTSRRGAATGGATSEQLLAQSLAQPTDFGSWGIIKTVALGGASFGILPLLLWPGRFRDAASTEAHQFRRLVEWARERGRSPAAIGPLRAAAEAVEIRPFFAVLPYLMGLLVIAGFAIKFADTGFSWDRLIGLTYGFDHRWHGYRLPWAPPPWSVWGSSAQIHALWCVALSAGYFFHYVQVRLHTADVRRFVGRFNRLAADEGIAPIPWPSMGGLLPVLWIGAAILFVRYDAWWGVALIASAMAERRMDRRVSRTIRAALAHRVQLMSPIRMASAERCPQARCLGLLPVQASFCPRCGARIRDLLADRAASGFRPQI